MAHRPLIGVVPLWDDTLNSLWMLPGYFDGIAEAGGIPVMLPLTDDETIIGQLVGQCDGFLVTGGHDVDPERYGEAAGPKTVKLCKARDRMEERLIPSVIAADKPLLGICRGIQSLNVALGGTLWQDLPDEHPIRWASTAITIRRFARWARDWNRWPPRRTASWRRSGCRPSVSSGPSNGILSSPTAPIATNVASSAPSSTPADASSRQSRRNAFQEMACPHP